ncbi:MAG: hypothetical protein B6I37_04510 [Desulfobacteraceae bacterium 4572_35.2]|nr:MAG: hypothetical protein B6I37_04510 [Desulfobacteraceae bacterium 4572_35.2]
MSFKLTSFLKVFLQTDNPLLVGRLAYSNREIFFEFDHAFPANTLNLSPFNLQKPSSLQVISGPSRLFEGLHGVFNDSLPDGWGRLLIDRKLRDLGIRPSQAGPLDRLSWVGSRGMGALVYVPDQREVLSNCSEKVINLDQMAKDSLLILENKTEEVFEYLLLIGGSPQGARPKALIGLSADSTEAIHGIDDLPEGYEHWLVKFPAQDDASDIGLVEKAYAMMAQDAGVDMAENQVLSSKRGPGYFATNRFDRIGNQRVHMHTLCGLLHADHRLPSIGYEEFLKATQALTRNHQDVKQAFVRMVFNVLSHNRDDHSKNHSFLMDSRGDWSLSPAYDVVFSDGPGGEQSLDVAGKGKEIQEADLTAIGEKVGLQSNEMKEAIDQVKHAVGDWLKYAQQCGVSLKRQKEIEPLLMM